MKSTKSNTKGAPFHLFQPFHPFFLFLFILLNLVISPIAKAEFGVAVGYGVASGLTAYRISLQASTFYCCQLGCQDIWPMSGFFELSYNQVNSKNDANTNTSLSVITTPPPTTRNNNSSIYGASLNHTFRWTKNNLVWCLAPYVEASPGIGFFSEGNVHGRNLDKSAIFELKFGVGFRFGRHREYDLGYKYIRFSKFSHIIRHSTSALGLNYLVLNLWF